MMMTRRCSRFSRFLFVLTSFALIPTFVSPSDVVVMTNRQQSEEHKHGHGTGQQNVLCYYTNWSQYRPEEGHFVPEDIDVSLCTHIVYAFAKIQNGVLAPYEWNDESTPWSKGMYERVNDLKKKKPGLKTLLSVGGWTLGSQPFSGMVATAETRRKFIDHAVVYLRNRTFDGLDVDWEYPTQRGSPPQDRDRFTLLLRELRAAFDREAEASRNDRLMLTVAVAAGKDNIDSAYDIPQIVKYVDFVDVLTYDLHGSWEPYTEFNSPLYALSSETGRNATLNQDWAVKYWISKGTPADKLNMGLAFYGRSFTLTNPEHCGVYAPASGPGQAGDFTRTAGFLSYYEVCRLLQQGGKKVFQRQQIANYAYRSNQWVGFDDEKSIKVKAAYVKRMKLAGAFVWSLDSDDFDADFCQHGTYPLLKTFVKALN